MKRQPKKLEEISSFRYLNTLFVETECEKVLGILDEEKAKASLEGIEVKVYLPQIDYRDFFLVARAIKWEGSTKYGIILYPEAMRKDNCSIREAIRHEIAHIKHGDLNKPASSLLEIIRREYRANKYEGRPFIDRMKCAFTKLLR